MSGIVAVMQEVARAEHLRSAPMAFVYGTVQGVDPLTVSVEGRFLLEGSQLVLSAMCRPLTITVASHAHTDAEGRDTDTRLAEVQVWRGLAQGDTVRMLSCKAGQLYYVLEREEGLP